MAAEENKEREMPEQVEVVIIGGGQAGLALSYYLTRQGRTRIVLEQGRVGEVWRSGRWDSFTLNTPNWMIQLPGFAYQGDDPDGFLPREDIVAYLEQYAASFQAPLQCGVRVTAVRQQPGGDGYLVEAEERMVKARNVVLATGDESQLDSTIGGYYTCRCEITTSRVSRSAFSATSRDADEVSATTRFAGASWFSDGDACLDDDFFGREERRCCWEASSAR